MINMSREREKAELRAEAWILAQGFAWACSVNTSSPSCFFVLWNDEAERMCCHQFGGVVHFVDSCP